MQNSFKKFIRRTVIAGIIGLFTLSVNPITVHADVPSATYVYQNYYANNPYVGLYRSSADGVAWTTVRPGMIKDGSTGAYVYDNYMDFWPTFGVSVVGTEVHPTLAGTRREETDPIIAQGGYHYYAKPILNSVIPVYWRVEYTDQQCAPVRNSGFTKFGLNPSLISVASLNGFHDIGWVCYCADCGKPIFKVGENFKMQFYMNDEAARSIPYIFVGRTSVANVQPYTYVYVEPHYGSHVIDFGEVTHSCNSYVSVNRYTIEYNKNASDAFVDDSYGFDTMCATDHFYTNQGSEVPVEYEGHPIEDYTGGTLNWLSISKNEYIRPDYICVGWAATAERANAGTVDFTDGCGIDEIEAFAKANPSIGNIHNLLSSENGKTVTLYAVWAPCHNTLVVNGGVFAASGSNGLYKGQTSYSYYNGYYRVDTIITPDELTAPGGFLVTFDGQGGTPSNSQIYADTEFVGWAWTRNVLGYSNVLDNEFTAIPNGIKTSYNYRHLVPIDGATVAITAQWQSKSLVLPGIQTLPDTDTAFTGWYTQPNGQGDFCGTAGSVYVPEGNITLYAYYGTLTIAAEEDYISNNNNGASDLEITWKDASVDSVYQYYRDDNNHTAVANTDINTYTNVSNWGGNNAELTNGITINYGSTAVQTYTVPQTGVYTLDLYGAQGGSLGNGVGGAGGEVKTTIVLRKGDVLSVYIGRQGDNANESNGTGGKTNIPGAGQSGGECSYIALARRSVWDNTTTTARIIMVAGGGGGGASGSNSYLAGGAGGSTSNVWNQLDSHGDLVYPVVADLVGSGPVTSASDYVYDGAYSQQTSKTIEGTTFSCWGAVGGTGGMLARGYTGGGGGIQVDSWGNNGVISFHTHNHNGCNYHDNYKQDTVCHGTWRQGNSWLESIDPHQIPGYFDFVQNGGGASWTTNAWANFTKANYSCSSCGRSYPANPVTIGFAGGWNVVSCDPYPGGIPHADGSGGGSGSLPGPSGECGATIRKWCYELGCTHHQGYNCGRNCYENDHVNAYINSITTSYGGGSFLAPSGDYAHTADIFKAGVRTGNGVLVITPPANIWDENYTMDDVPSPDMAAPDPVADYSVEMAPNGTYIGITVNMPMDNGTNWWWMGKATQFGSNGSAILADYLGTAPASVTKPVMDTLTTGVVKYKFVCNESPTMDQASVMAATVNGNNVQEIATSWASMSGTGAPNGVKFLKWYKAFPLQRVTSFQVTPIGKNQYMHIVAIDKAGNVSPVADLMIENVDGTDPRFFVAYPIKTNQLTTLLSDYVYANGTNAEGYKVYYVNTGSAKPIYLNYSAEFRLGSPRAGYQINDAIFSTVSYSGVFGTDRRLIATVANGDITNAEQRIYDVKYKTFGAGNVDAQGKPIGLLMPYTSTYGTRYFGNRLALTQQVYTSSFPEGVPQLIYPRATAYMEQAWAIALRKTPAQRAVMSTSQQDDINNGLVFIGDGTAPTVTATLYINGGQYGSPSTLEGFNIANLFNLEPGQDSNQIDRRNNRVEIKLEVTDPALNNGAVPGSGLKEWSYTIDNADNGLSRTVSFDASTTSVTFDISVPYNTTTGTYDNILFNGEFSITAHTVDNVSNEKDYKTHTNEFDLRAEDHRYLDEITGPLINANGERYYQEGEAGFIKVFSWGYADWIEVKFLDAELEEYSTAIIFDGSTHPSVPNAIYSTKNWMTEDNVDFTIPLYYGRDRIYVQIIAHKGGATIEWNTALNVGVEGTILDEFRSTVEY